MQVLMWLYPGMRVKRYLFLLALGVLLVSGGTALILGDTGLYFLETILFFVAKGVWSKVSTNVARGLGLLIACAGVALISLGLRQTIRSLMGVVSPVEASNLAEVVYTKRHLQRGPKIVVVGGGTGLSVLLRGLKHHTSNITAIVTVADDGGSSGRIRNELGILPPGDARNTLVALADTEPLMERLFQYRFDHGGGDLAGHNFGNLFIAAMTAITGDFERAIRESSKVLAIRGQVLPSTLAQVVLRAEFEDGTHAEGESVIPAARKRIRRVSLHPSQVEPVAEALVALKEADLIVLGPGSLYTSVLPNLLVPGITEAIRSSRAVRVYVCNVMTQPGETEGYRGSDHVKAILDHVGDGIIDYVLLNRASISGAAARRYRREGSFPVLADVDAVRALGPIPVTRALVNDVDLVRHDPNALARAVLELIGVKGPKRRVGPCMNGLSGSGGERSQSPSSPHR